MLDNVYRFPVPNQANGVADPLLFEFGEPMDGLVRHESMVYGREIDTFHFDNPDSV